MAKLLRPKCETPPLLVHLLFCICGKKGFLPYSPIGVWTLDKTEFGLGLHMMSLCVLPHLWLTMNVLSGKKCLWVATDFKGSSIINVFVVVVVVVVLVGALLCFSPAFCFHSETLFGSFFHYILMLVVCLRFPQQEIVEILVFGCWVERLSGLKALVYM